MSCSPGPVPGTESWTNGIPVAARKFAGEISWMCELPMIAAS